MYYDWNLQIRKQEKTKAYIYAKKLVKLNKLMHINSNKLKQLRQSKKLSRFQLALECDISQSTIEKIEYGTRSGLCVLIKLAIYFNVTIDELL